MKLASMYGLKCDMQGCGKLHSARCGQMQASSVSDDNACLLDLVLLLAVSSASAQHTACYPQLRWQHLYA